MVWGVGGGWGLRVRGGGGGRTASLGVLRNHHKSLYLVVMLRKLPNVLPGTYQNIL